MNSAIRHSLHNQHCSLTPHVPRALYLRATQQNYSTTDIWADALLNKSAHASDSLGSTHALFAQELARIANSKGVLTTCVESSLPYRNTGTDNQTWKQADMMTLTGCGVTPNAQRNFSVGTRLIMDVTMGNVFDTHHCGTTISNQIHFWAFQIPNAFNTQTIINDSVWPLLHPIVANSLEQFDTLRFLLNLVDHQGKNTFGFIIDSPSNTTSQISPSICSTGK